MKASLLQRCQWSVNRDVVSQLGDTFKLPSAKVIWVVDVVLPVMIAALAKTASHARGTRALYAAIMSPKVDAQITQNLVNLLDDLNATEHAVRIGCDRATSFLGEKMPQLAHVVSDNSGARAEAVTGIMGVMTVLLFGVIKNHLLARQGQQYALIDLLKTQMTSIQNLVTPGCWTALAYGDIEHFQRIIDAELELALTHFRYVSPDAAPSHLQVNGRHDGQSSPHAAMLNGANFYHEVMKRIKNSRKETQNLVLWQLLPMVLLLSCMYGFKHLAVKSPIPITLSAVHIAPVLPSSSSSSTSTSTSTSTFLPPSVR